MTARAAGWLAVMAAAGTANAQPGPSPAPAPAAPPAAPAPLAQPPDPAVPAATVPPGAPVDDGAAAHLQRGIAAYRAHHFTQAVDELLQANRLAPERPEPYRWLALTEVEIDDCPSALLNVDAFFARAPRGSPAAAELLGLRDRCLHTGRVNVESSPGGAELHIDDGPVVATTPISGLALRIGTHAVTLRKPGFETLHDRLDVQAAGTSYASFVLRPEHHTSLTQRWWFWAALGAVAVTAIGVTYEATRTSEPQLPGVICTSTGCTP